MVETFILLTVCHDYWTVPCDGDDDHPDCPDHWWVRRRGQWWDRLRWKGRKEMLKKVKQIADSRNSYHMQCVKDVQRKFLAGKGRLSSDQVDAIKRDLQVGLLDGLDGLDNMISTNRYKNLWSSKSFQGNLKDNYQHLLSFLRKLPLDHLLLHRLLVETLICSTKCSQSWSPARSAEG